MFYFYFFRSRGVNLLFAFVLYAPDSHLFKQCHAHLYCLFAILLKAASVC